MKEKKLTFHWVIVLAVFLMFAASVGVAVNCFSVFGPAIMKDMGYTASEVQLINLFCVIANLLGGLLIGKVMAKCGMRLSLTVGAVIIAAGTAMRSMSHSMFTFSLWSFVMGIGLASTSTIPGSMLINNWFTDKKGTATGIAFSGSVVGGLVFVQLSKVLVEAMGWRQANLVMAAIAALILIPTSIFLVREHPRNKNMLPLGAEHAGGQTQAEVTGISPAAYYKTASFWLLAFTIFAIGFCNMGMQNNVTICLESEYGHTGAFAANIFSVVMAVQIAGKILLGAIYDKKGVKFGTIYNLVLFALVVVTILLSKNTAMAVAFGCVFGLMCSMTTVTPPYLAALAVGRKNYSTIYGMLCLFFGIGCALGPVFAGAVFDKTGSYTPAWLVFAAVSAVLTVTSILSVKTAKGFAEIRG